MEIHDFSGLTNFIGEEQGKMIENFGITQPSSYLLKFSEKNLIKYVKLYRKPLIKKEKREIKIQEAIDTMPHGFLWKIFNSKLWKIVKHRLKEIDDYKKDCLKENMEQRQVITTLPVIVQQASVPVPSDLSGEIQKFDDSVNEGTPT